MQFGSPNACNSCHKDKDAAWADQKVRQWRTRDYQAPVLRRAGLIEAARKRDWQKLPEMLAYMTSPERDEVFAASLLRLTMDAPDEGVSPALLKAIQDPSPLVRAAAAEALGVRASRESFQALVIAAGDSYRLVRVRAAASLARYPAAWLPGEDQEKVKQATDEYLASLTARPDQWTSHYNLGNYYLNRGEVKQALAAYGTALKIEPRAAMVMVNTAMAYAQAGEKQQAEKFLLKAIKVAPDNAAAHFNLGLLKAEQNRGKEAERELREALRLDPKMAPAAYNLCILTAKDRPAEALSWCRKAVALNPQEPRYAYTLAFYQKDGKDLHGRGGDPQRSPGATARFYGRLPVAGRNSPGAGRSPPGRSGAPPGPPGGESSSPRPGPGSRGAPEIEPAGTPIAGRTRQKAGRATEIPSLSRKLDGGARCTGNETGSNLASWPCRWPLAWGAAPRPRPSSSTTAPI